MNMSKKPEPVNKFPLRYVADTHIKDRPLAFVDLEFSGLGAENEILQIGCVLVSQPDFKIIGEWQTKVRPSHIKNGDPKALRLIGYNARKWRGALELRDTLEQFNAFAKDAVLVGYNVVGDFYQLKRSYHLVGILPAYHWQVLDVLPMLYLELYKSRLKGYRMKEVAKYLRLRGGHWHDALVDARTTFDIFKKLFQDCD